jgi:hypothetical protein
MNADHVTSIVCVALAVLGLVFLYVLARIGGQIVSCVLEERRPKPKLDHPELGVITFDKYFWRGERTHRGNRFVFYVDGPVEGPSPPAVARLLAVLKNVDATTETAVDYLMSTKDNYPFLNSHPLRREMWRLEDVGGPDENGDFDLHMELEGEPNGSWIVQFKAGRPVFSGYED